ncbi:hypothetical protein XA68_16572 [Ophiocordyceps unilateralis]|uniref:Laccase n=1 Tax=Ophiocordyceps unilateralis TaxID=268505 RepID=A0A2A9PJZ5_OPHUN|nr:hypothetical protein XA68_16572 [Ophiocordyceps unilateralis]
MPQPGLFNGTCRTVEGMDYGGGSHSMRSLLLHPSLHGAQNSSRQAGRREHLWSAAEAARVAMLPHDNSMALGNASTTRVPSWVVTPPFFFFPSLSLLSDGSALFFRPSINRFRRCRRGQLPWPGSIPEPCLARVVDDPSTPASFTPFSASCPYDFNITWVRRNPDGAFERPVIGINNQWPIPPIHANVGDRVVVRVRNLLGNQTTSLHFHGLFMRGTPHMDGPDAVSQCPIPPGAEFTYDFTIDQPGTYWYHSHTHAQYPDGLRGPLIVHDVKFPYRDDVDEELVLTLSDWYHDEMQTLIPRFLSKNNPTGAEPVPNSALLNETQNLQVHVRPRRKYLLRIINMGAFAGQFFWIEGHSLTVVEVDGVYTKPAEAQMIYLSAAQRTSVIVETRGDASANFPIVASMDTALFDVLPEDLNYNSTGWLVYDDAKPKPEPAPVDELEPFDDMKLIPWDDMELLPSPDRVLQLDVAMDNLGDGANYAFFGNITYAPPKVPSLYTALSAGDLATNPAVYGEYAHPFVLKKGEVVQVVVNNLDPGRHPFHLHGHNFQALYRSAEEEGTFADVDEPESKFARVPMRRDTLVVFPNGNIVLRFRADNPGNCRSSLSSLSLSLLFPPLLPPPPPPR